MGVDVEKVGMELGARDVNFTRVFGNAQKSIDALQGSYAKLAGFVTGGVVVGGFLASMKSVIDAGDAVNKASEKFGIGTESLSSLRFAAKLANVEFGDLENGLKKLSVNSAAAAGGAKEQGAIFEAMGIKVGNTSGQLKATDTLLREIADKFALYEDGPAKAALAVELFGKSGASLIPLLNKMREAEEEARQLGAIYGKGLAKASEDFNDNLTRMNAVLQANKLAIANDWLPWVNKMLEQMIEGKKIAGGFFDALRLFGLSTINSDNAGASIRSINEELTVLQAKLANPPARGGSPMWRSAIESDIADLEKQKQFAQFLQRQSALGLGGTDTPGERARMGLNKTQAPLVKKAGDGAGGAADNTFEQLLRQYQELAAKAGELTVFEQTLKLLETDRYRALLPNQKSQILNLAAAVDLAKEDARVQTEAEQASERAAQEELRRGRAEADRLEQGKQKWLDTIDVMARYRREIADIDELEKLRYLDPDQAIGARRAIWQAQLEAQQKLNDKVEKGVDLWKDFGISAGNSLEEIIFKGGKARDVLAAMARTLAGAAFRETATNPLASAAGPFFKGLFDKIFNTPHTTNMPSGLGYGTIDPTESGYGGFAGGGSFTVGGMGLSLIHI